MQWFPNFRETLIRREFGKKKLLLNNLKILLLMKRKIVQKIITRGSFVTFYFNLQNSFFFFLTLKQKQDLYPSVT